MISKWAVSITLKLVKGLNIWASKFECNKKAKTLKKRIILGLFNGIIVILS
jgi:hypothetical protein